MRATTIRNWVVSCPETANFAQKTFRATFDKGGTFAGKSVDDIASALRAGSMKTADVPIDFIVRDGHTLILNTRSAQALSRAGIPDPAKHGYATNLDYFNAQ